MTSDLGATNPQTAFVWVWLPAAEAPVVAGRLDATGSVYSFTYGRTYLQRADSIPLFLPDLPLQTGPQYPSSGAASGCLIDAGPDAWGRRAIQHRRSAGPNDIGLLGYLLETDSNRIGAFDFQTDSSEYVDRSAGNATLDELVRAAEFVESGTPLPPELDEALLRGTSIGGARPKALLNDGDRQLIAKFASTADTRPVVASEFIAMELARHCGLDVARVELTAALGKEVLLVERFDRPGGQRRSLMVSAMTILDLHDADGMAARYATYHDLADQIRARFSNPDATLAELFGRIVFNILVGNTDDHARNHAAFWDGQQLTLTPAYDLCPQVRAGEEANQAMAFGPSERLSQVVRCVRHAAIYHLTTEEARSIIDSQIGTITKQWPSVCDEAELPEADRSRLWNRQFLNPFALYGY